MSVSAKVAIVLALGFTLLVQLGCTGPAEKRATITVAAASSLTAAMEEVAALWNERSDVEVRCTFGATSSLVRQIERGAPYDIMLSANDEWLDYLVAAGHVSHADKFLLGHNHLALVASLVSGASLKEETMFKAGRWALGDPDHVPVGIYAKRELERLSHWREIEDRVVPAANARAALRLLERGEVEYGVLYATDVIGNDLIHVVCLVPSAFVRLTGAPVASAGGDAREFALWLQRSEVDAILRSHGFDVEERMPGDIK